MATNRSRNWTQNEVTLLIAWAKGMGFGVNNNKGSVDLVIDRLASGTDEALNTLASGQLNAAKPIDGIEDVGKPRSAQAIWGRWSKHTKEHRATWEKLMDKRWGWDEKQDKFVDMEEVAEDEEMAEEEEVNEEEERRRAAIEREIREIEKTIKLLQPYREPDLLQQTWDEDKVFELYDDLPLSHRLAGRRYGGRTLYQRQAKTPKPLPEDEGKRTDPEDPPEAPNPKRRRKD